MFNEGAAAAKQGDLVQARTHRREDWFADTAGRIELCNVPLPVRLETSD